jgi:hypothetical protein
MSGPPLSQWLRPQAPNRARLQKHKIPVVPFERGQRKDTLARKMRRQRPVRDALVFVGVAQEKAYGFKATKDYTSRPGQLRFHYFRQSVFVKHYYFYVGDPDFGEAFIKVCTYAPWAVKVCLNGHEWAKRQLPHAHIGFEALDNGFAQCDDPQRLQQCCDQLGPEHIQAFLNRWLQRLPFPLDGSARQAGYTPR